MARSTRRLVGRDAELAHLTGALGLAVRPSDVPRRHVLLGGDAGVGKTRVLAELRARAAGGAWQAFVGRCLDFGDSAESYLPFTEILEQMCAALPELVTELADEHPALIGLSPAARALVGSEPREVLDRGNLFAAVHALFEASAAKAPVLVVVEDAHWADQSTRDLLTFLFARRFASPVSLVVSYRADDLHRRHPLRRQLAEWTRLPAVERMVLEPLGARDVRRLARALDRRLTDAEVEAVVARADGNAFFTEELVEAASGTTGVVPSDLADLLLVRLDRLDETTREVVRTASAAGRDVSEELLAAVAGLDQPALDAALRQAVEMNILVVREDGYYVFRHALLGEAVYDDLLPGQRVRLHQRYVAALRGGLTTGTAAGLARHARLAGDRETALEAGIRAGDVAAAAGGPAEAAKHYQQAISLLTEMPDHDTGELVALVVKAGEAMIAAGQADRAGRLARELYQRLPNDAPGRWRAELIATDIEAGFAYVDGRNDLPLSRAAVAALPPDAPPLVRARVYAAHTRVLMIGRRHLEAEWFGREALALAERLDRPHLAAELAVTLAAPWGRPAEERIATMTAAVERAARAGALQAELRGRLRLGFIHHEMGDLAGATHWHRSGHELALQRGIPWAPYAFDARVHLMGCLLRSGHLPEAVALADVPGAPPVLAAWITARRLLADQALGIDVGDQARSLRAFWRQEIAIAFDSCPAEVVAAGQRGDVAGVLEAYDAGTAAVSAVRGFGADARVRFAAALAGQVAALMATLPAAERRGVLDELRRRESELADAVPVPGSAWGLEGRVWGLRLRAESLRARWLAGVDVPQQDDLVAAWRAAESSYADLGYVYELAVVRATLADILRATGDPATGRDLAAQARAAATSLGVPPLLDRVPEPRAPRGEPDALTPREAEILALVAEGRTNGEIGRQLFISAKTVSVHVSNILAKLGAAGRTEAAAIARRRGLLV